MGAVVAVAAAAIAVSVSGRGGTARAAVGEPAPLFTLTSLDGREVSLESFRGRPVMLNFWASWCLPCRKELPLLLATASRHRDEGLALVGVVYQDEVAPARSFHRYIGGDWPGLVDPEGEVASAYLVRGVPQTFFIDRAGVLRGHHIGEVDQPDLDANLPAILG